MQKRENLILLSDGAGEIVEVGAGVTEWKVGDRALSDVSFRVGRMARRTKLFCGAHCGGQLTASHASIACSGAKKSSRFRRA